MRAEIRALKDAIARLATRAPPSLNAEIDDVRTAFDAAQLAVEQAIEDTVADRGRHASLVEEARKGSISKARVAVMQRVHNLRLALRAREFERTTERDAYAAALGDIEDALHLFGKTAVDPAEQAILDEVRARLAAG